MVLLTLLNKGSLYFWIFNLIFSSPVMDIVVTNDRWGKDAMCKRGEILMCMDRYNYSIKEFSFSLAR